MADSKDQDPLHSASEEPEFPSGDEPRQDRETRNETERNIEHISGDVVSAVVDADESETVMSGLAPFLKDVTYLYPQEDVKGRLNYYFAGSLSVLMMIRAGEFEELDCAQLPAIVPVKKRQIPAQAIEGLAGFTRRIGDMDIVPVITEKGRYPGKGGSIRLDQLSDVAKRVLKLNETSKSLMCDPLTPSGEDDVVRVSIGGKEYFTAHPADILAYKAIHIAQSFDNESKTDKMIKDFESILDTLMSLYGYDELVNRAFGKAMSYTSFSPNALKIPYHNKRLPGRIRKFFDDLVQCHPDSILLKDIPYGKERVIGFVSILERLKSPEAKRKMVEFIVRHRAEVDRWKVNTSDDMISSSRPERTPVDSWLLNGLKKAQEQTLDADLDAMDAILDKGCDQFKVFSLFENPLMGKGTVRKNVEDAVREAAIKMSDALFDAFITDMARVMREDMEYDAGNKKWLTIPEEERLKRLNELIGGV